MKRILICASRISHIIQFHLPYLKWFTRLGYEVHIAAEGAAENAFRNAIFPLEETDIPKHCYDLRFVKNPASPENLKTIRILHRLMRDNAYEMVYSNATLAGFALRTAVRRLQKDKRPYCVHISHGYMFDDNNGKQTADCSHAAIDADLTLYVWLLPDAGVQVIDNPATFDPSDVPATVWAIVGLQNDWTNGIAMTPVANDENSVEAQFNYDSLEANFKFKVYGAAWNNNYYGPADGNDLNYDLTAEYVTLALGTNGNIFLPAVGNYKATLTIAGDNAGRLKIVAVQ